MTFRLSTQQVLKDKQTRDPNSITSLSLSQKALSDVSCFSEFVNLERLDLAFNNLASLQGLSSCVNLKWLSVAQNKLESLKGIETLSKLTVLNAGKNKLKSMDEVRSLVTLRALILNDNEIVSICKLDQMKELNTLVLSRNPISELGDSLVKVKSMTKLSLSNCQLQTIGSSLKSCIELRELRLAHNDIKTLPAELTCNKKLQNLDLGNNVITRWSDVKVLSSLIDLKNLNLQGNPIAENDKIAKKIKKLLPHLHVFNARPIDKSSKNEHGDRNDEVENQKEKKNDNTLEKKYPKHGLHKSKSGHIDSVEKDLKQGKKGTKSELSKKEEAVDQKDDIIIEKKLKRKKSHEKQDRVDDLDIEDLKLKRKKTDEKLIKKDVPIHEDDSTTVKKKKSEKSKEKPGELDIIDSAETSFSDLLSADTVVNPKHGGEKKIFDKTVKGTNAESGLVTISTKKKKTKNQGFVSTVQLSPAVEVGMGGTSTWGDE